MIDELVKNLSVFDYYYYNKKEGCKAALPTDDVCICWHKEGTGPNAHVERHGDLVSAYSFERGYSTIKLRWKKKLNMVKVNIYILVAFIPAIILHYV